MFKLNYYRGKSEVVITKTLTNQQLARFRPVAGFSQESLKQLPWVLAVIVVLGVGSFFAGLYLADLQTQTPEVSISPPVTTPSPAPSITPKPAVPTGPTQSEQLQQLLNKFVKNQPADFYIYVEDLKSGTKAAIDEHTSVPSGSIYKMFLANQVYRLNEAGKLNMNSLVAGTSYSFASCTMQMVQNSFNFCGETVRNHLGAVPHTKSLNNQGYKNTNLMRSDAAHTSAYDVALLYKRLYRGNYFSKAHTTEFLGYLRNQMWRFRIPTGMPIAPTATGKAVTYNKTGDVFSYANDSALVKGEKTDFILVVLSGGWKTVFPDSSIAIRHLTGLVYNFLNNTNHPLPY